MTFYQELQLSSVGSKTTDQKYRRPERKTPPYSDLQLQGIPCDGILCGSSDAVHKSDRKWQQRCGSNSTACCACAQAGGFRNQNDTWTGQHYGNFCDSYDCTAVCQHP